MAKVSFNIVTWNGARYLPELFSSLGEQTFEPLSVRVIDNASDDETVDLLRTYPNTTLIRNARNLGFASGHNQGFRLAIDKWEGEDLDHCYVIVANQDLVLTPTFVEKIVEVMEDHPGVGSAQGKLLRAFVEHPEDDYLAQTICADRIDSTGLRGSRGRRFSDRGAGQMDTGQYEEEEDIFGPTGALAIYRASALQAVRYKDEFYDGDFFMYREDIDLAWRLRLLGWKSLYAPSAVAYHHRGLFGAERPGLLERIRNRQGKRPILSMLSTRNQWLMVIKNEMVWNVLLASPWIIFVELRQVIYSLLFEPRVLRKALMGLRLIPRMWRKRQVTMKARQAKAKDLRKWFR